MTDDPKLKISLPEEVYQRLKIDADRLGISVADMLQRELDTLATKMFGLRAMGRVES